MADWSPAQYLRFGAERLRPGLDLLARIPLDAPRVAYDLGCGAGALTSALKERWPNARVVGVDASEAMLAKAGASPAGIEIEWRRAELDGWRPDVPASLIFSNAALHWLDDHRSLFPALVRALAPGGVLAVQMPNNFAAPTHTAIEETARDARWRARIEPTLRRRPVLAAREYHALLDPLVPRVDVWETIYYHLLAGNDPVVEWTKGSVLRPVLEPLDAGERQAFLALYREALREAYPMRDDGKTLLPFRRLFLVAATDA